MNFEDEHYVRIYTRHTKTVKKWGWEGRVLFRELTATVDKAGILDDIDDHIEDVALMVELPREVVEVGLPRLIRSKSIEIVGNRLVIPNYVEAQTARKSDAQRARESRERRSLAARQTPDDVTNRDAGVTKRTDCDETEQDPTTTGNVTSSDEPVTNRDDVEQKRDEPSDPVRSCHSTQCNADQINTKQNSEADEVLRVTTQERARRLLANPFDAQFVDPKSWPEFADAAAVVHQGLGFSGKPKLGGMKDPAVKQLVEVFAAGFTLDEIREAAPNLLRHEFVKKVTKMHAVTPSVLRDVLDGNTSSESPREAVLSP